MIGGSADLTGSVNTLVKGMASFDTTEDDVDRFLAAVARHAVTPA